MLPTLIFSFPVTVEGGEWKIVQGLELDDFAKAKIAATTKVQYSQGGYGSSIGSEC